MSLVAENKEHFASDSGHWYRPDGTPCYEVPYKDKNRHGEMRATKLGDARELGLFPSVTTILKLIPKDGLTRWIKKQVALAAYKVIPVGYETEEEWSGYILGLAETAMNEQREKGSRDHGIVEEYFRLVSHAGHRSDRYDIDVLYADCAPVNSVNQALETLGLVDQRARSEKSFACPLGYGGKIDLSGYDEPWIVDFKFVSHLDKKLDYIDRCAQGAAYLFGKYRTMEYCRFANIFVSTEDYSFQIKEWTYDELRHGWDVFWACFELWKILNRYDPLDNKL